jgi:hypothetical protein
MTTPDPRPGYPAKDEWLQFRRTNAPHHYSRPATVAFVELRDGVTALIRASDASFDEASDACWQAIDNLIRDGKWPSGHRAETGGRR